MAIDRSPFWQDTPRQGPQIGNHSHRAIIAKAPKPPLNSGGRLAFYCDFRDFNQPLNGTLMG